MFVVDASVVLAWLIPEEQSGAAEKVVAAAKRTRPVAPALLPLEVANALRTKLRRGDIDAGFRDQALTLFERLGVERDLESHDFNVLRETVRLADVHGLTAYDAAYLEAAIRYGAPLGTLDEDLRRAARVEGIDVHPS